MERFAADARDVFDEDVLRRLSVGDRAMLALVSRSMRDVVFTSSVGDVKDVAAVRRELGRMPNFVGSVGRLAWAKELGCPWNENTCAKAAEGGHLEVLQWARANGCSVGREDLPRSRGIRSPRGAAVGARERLPVGRVDLPYAAGRRPPGGAAVGARERLSVDENTCRLGRARRPPGGAAVGARERLLRGTRGLARSRA